jgi:hypothetical protein
MPLSLSGSGGITYPDGTVNATRSVSVAGDTMTGNLTAPNLLRAGSQVFSRDNIVGTVSQTSGIPTGAVMETGSNNNGNFTRFANGLLICVSPTSWGETGEFTWTFPAAFNGNPSVTCIGGLNVGENPSSIGAIGFQSLGTASVLIRKQFTGSRTALSIAIGRWF